MKKSIIISLALITVITLTGCTSKQEETYKNNPEIYNKKTKQCIEPENPYNEWSGHYAGYKWYEDTGNNCWGNSSSFIEGCEVAEEQYSVFTECEDAQ
jgi:uncharacterized lipoprotein NlpE involved in copper resistance